MLLTLATAYYTLACGPLGSFSVTSKGAMVPPYAKAPVAGGKLLRSKVVSVVYDASYPHPLSVTATTQDGRTYRFGFSHDVDLSRNGTYKTPSGQRATLTIKGL